MTVGVAAISGQYDDPVAILGADRLVTTQQLSAIEHESPNTKIKEIGHSIPGLEAAGVFSGDISWADELHAQIENRCINLRNQEDNVNFDGSLLMRIASEQYRSFTNNRIQNQILSKYGLDIEDLQSQHKFKEGFVADIKAEIENAESTVNSKLQLLIGGVNTNVDRAFVFEVRNGDHLPHTNEGYATIGSGSQPAHSEFIESEYGPKTDIDEAVATVTAATLRARQASGVGGDIDIWAIKQSGIQPAPDRIINDLKTRYQIISTTQDKVKENLREYNAVQWRP